MDDNDIPDDCIDDPSFVQVLTTALTTGIERNENLLEGYLEGTKKRKAAVSRGVENRKNIKQQIQDIKERKALMEPLVEHLTQNEGKRTTELALLKNQLDEGSLRKKAVREKYNEILNAYKETWKRYKAEYEEFEMAVERRKCRVEVETLKIQCMVEQQKKLEYVKMLKQREKIYKKRNQSAVIASAKMILDGWKKQKYLNTLNDGIRNAQAELEIIEKKSKELHKFSQTEAENKALGRQQTPFPRLDISLVQSFYVSGNSHSRPKETAVLFKHKIDPDTVSVNTIMFEQMCNDEENVHSDSNHENHDHVYNEENESSLPMQQTTDCTVIPNNTVNPETVSNIEGLENVCSQLSINDDTCNDIHHAEEIEEHQSQPISKKQFSPEQICNEEVNPLKHKLPTPEELNVNEGEPRVKQTRTVELIKEIPPLSPSTNKNNSCPENTNSPSGKEQVITSSAVESLPQIKKVETITRPITVQLKPPMAEVPPTPSSLFSPRHYAQSYASSDNLSHFFDNPCNDLTEDVCGLDNYNDNWPILSPPQAGSEISFNSIHVPGKESAADNNISAFPNPVDKPTSNFFSFFNTGSTNPKSYI